MHHEITCHGIKNGAGLTVAMAVNIEPSIHTCLTKC